MILGADNLLRDQAKGARNFPWPQLVETTLLGV